MAGRRIDGNELRKFDPEPILTAPIVCQLCGAGFTSDEDSAKHVVADHVSMGKYRKRTIYVMEMQVPDAITAQEQVDRAELRQLPTRNHSAR